MKKLFCTLVFLVCVFSFILSSAEFKLYPGAKLDSEATKKAMDEAQMAKMKNVKVLIYTTRDSFQKVSSFYKGIAKEFKMPYASGTSGKPKKYENYDLFEAFFIFDGKEDLASSKLWVKVQHPCVGENIRDLTAIIVYEEK